MGKRRNLKREEKEQIRRLSQNCNHSYKQIADKLNLSMSSVHRVLKKSPHRTKVKQGRKEVLNARQKRSLTRFFDKNPSSSAEKAGRVLNLPCSSQTIRRLLKRKEFANIKVPREKGITKKNQEKRRIFARDHAYWTDEWNNVVFSDEKKWNLVGPDGLTSMWVNMKKNINTSLLTRATKSVMVWGAISASGPLKLVLMKGKFNTKKYIEMISTNLFFHADSPIPANSLFQQDNAPIHVSKEAKQWFETNQIEVMEWPPQSPDLSPIENVWGILTQRVYANGRFFNSTNELWETIQFEWNKLTAADMYPLYASMHNRILNVIENQGKKIPH